MPKPTPAEALLAFIAAESTFLRAVRLKWQ
jgi:hypothetical protein